MWRDIILETKKAKGITTKSMADYTHMTEKTIKRILSGETGDPYVDTVIILGASVGLAPIEIFADTGLIVGTQDLAVLQAEVARLTAELEARTTEAATVRTEASDLAKENALLRLKLEHMEELIRHKDEIIALLRRP